LNNLAILHEAEGDLAGAKSRFEQALSLWRNTGQISESTAAMLGLGEVQLAQGDLAGARKTQEEAFAQRQKLGEKGSIAESQLALALISLEEGRPADAERTVRAAAAEFHEERVPDLEASAYAVLARALLDQHRLTEAHDAAKNATSLVVRTQEPMLKLSVAIADARVRAGDGHAIKSDTIAQSLHELEGVLREARRFGFVGLGLEARLAVVEIARGARGITTRHQEPALLEQEALMKGYGLIARKVSVQGSPPS
jgi:tetratricopeptide (TPR) repeat protein